MSARTVDGKWVERPFKFQSIRYVSRLPDDAILTKTAYYSASTGKAYFYVSDAEKIYLPGTYVVPAVEINNNLSKFGLGTIQQRQQQIDAVMFNIPDVVDSSDLWSKILGVLSAWVLTSLVLGLPVLVVIFGWRRLFQWFLIRELGKTIRGRVEDVGKD